VISDVQEQLQRAQMGYVDEHGYVKNIEDKVSYKGHEAWVPDGYNKLELKNRKQVRL
jgi:hypothetical protein